MGNPLYLALGAQPWCVHDPSAPTQPSWRVPRTYFFGGGVFKSSYILSRGIRLPNSRRIRKAPGLEWSGWEFTVSLPCLTATS